MVLHKIPLLCLLSALSGSITLAQNAVSLITEPAIQSYRLFDHYKGVATGQRITSPDGDTDQSFHVEVHATPVKHWHVVLGGGQNELPIEKGDIIRFAIELRSTAPGQRSMVQLCVQDGLDNFKNIATLDSGSGEDFSAPELKFEAEQDYAARQLSFNVFLGQQIQSLEIKNIEVTQTRLSGQGNSPRPELMRLTFDGEYAAPEMNKGEKSQILGEVPVPLIEDSSWADVDVTYSSEAGIWRVDIEDIRGGFVQQLLQNVAATNDYFTRIKIEAKSPTTTNFELTLRNSKTFSSYWRDVTATNPEWREFEFLIPPLKEDPTAELALAFKSAGTVDFRSIEVEYFTATELGLNEGLEGNLLPNSSLPFGTVAPWHGNSQLVQEWHQNTDPAEVGPTGVPAYKLDGYGKEQHFNAPFKGQPGAIHTLSFWAKTNREGTGFAMRMGSPSEKLWIGEWNKNINLTTEWERYSHSVKLPFNTEGFYVIQLRMDTDADVWVDGLMVEASAELNEFQRVAPVELSISPVSEMEPYAIYYPDQTMAIRVNGQGKAPEGSYIRSSVGEFRSNERFPQKHTPMSAGKLSETVVTIDDTGLPEYGSYRAEVQVFDASGNAISPIKDILLHRVRAPRMLGQFAEDSPFGAHTSADYRQAAGMKAIGVNWIRSFKFGWSRFWKGGPDGNWDFSEGDARVEAYASNHLYIQTALAHPPRWATDAPEDLRHFRVTQFVPSDEYLDRWADYAHTLASRYKGKIYAYESWNEPFFRAFMIGGVDDNGDWVHATPEKFVAMTQATYKAIKDADPAATQIWNVGGKNEPWFDDAVADLDIWDYFDVASYHNYTTNIGGFPGDSFQQGAQAAFEVFERNGKDPYEMWNTEGGPGGSHFHFFSPHGPARDTSAVEDQTSTYIARAYTSMLAAGVKKYFIFKFDYGYWTANYALNQPSGHFAPNAVAYSNMAWHLEGKEYAKTIQILDGSWNAFIFEDENESAALLVPRKATPYRIPDVEGLKAHGLYGNLIPAGEERRTDTWFLGEKLSADELAKVLTKDIRSNEPK